MLVLKLTITPEALVDLFLAIDICPVEISGLGRIEVRGNERRIEEIILFPQECSMVSTEFDKYDPRSVERYWTELMRQGRGKEINFLHCWWHSHVWGHTYFSGIDRENIKCFVDSCSNNEESNPFWISIVGNKKHELNVRFDLAHPLRLTGEDLPLELCGGKLEDLRPLYRERHRRMEEIVGRFVKITGFGRAPVDPRRITNWPPLDDDDTFRFLQEGQR